MNEIHVLEWTVYSCTFAQSLLCQFYVFAMAGNSRIKLKTESIMNTLNNKAVHEANNQNHMYVNHHYYAIIKENVFV